MLKKVLKQYKKTISFYLINGLITIITASVAVVYFQKLLDQIVTINHMKPILLIFIIYGTLLIVSTILEYIDEYPMRILSNGIYHRLKVMAVEKVSKVDYASYRDMGTGRLVQLIENGATAGRKILYDFYIYILRYLLPTIIINLILIGFYNIQVMLIISIGYVFIFIISNILLKYLYKLKSDLLNHEEDFSKRSVRGFMELVVFRINKRFKKEIEKITDTSNHIVKSKAKLRMIHELFFVHFALMVIVVKLVIIYTGIKQILIGNTTIGTIIALLTFTDRIFTPIAIFNVKYVEYKLDKLSYKRFENFLNLPDDKQLNQGKKFNITKGAISFSDVKFGYENETLINNLSFQIKGGSQIAFVGTSGAGKSTVIKLILGLLKPVKGQIFIDTSPLDSMELNHYYESISYVSQDAPIFDGTLRENIVFDELVQDEKIYKILDLVLLKDFVEKLPHGLDTQVGEKGVKLSGGEKQRLAFARVFFQKSKIVILDEPTSALDSLTETVVTENMLSVLKNKTIIIIAHRLQTIKSVDDILVMSEGQIVERGNFKELLIKDGLFNKLWYEQTKSLN